MERRYLIDNLGRSITMLTPGAPALNREQAMRMVSELEDTDAAWPSSSPSCAAWPTRPKPAESATLEGMVPDLAPMLADRGLPRAP